MNIHYLYEDDDDDDDVGFTAHSYRNGGPYNQNAWQNKYE